MPRHARPTSRRGFLRGAAALTALGGGAARCAGPATPRQNAVLRARPAARRTTLGGGIQVFSEGGAAFYLPEAAGDEKLPLVVVLHGAGGNGDEFLHYFTELSGPPRVALLAPSSLERTWDAALPQYRTFLDLLLPPALPGFGADVASIDRALAHIFQRVVIDPARIAIGGFSDGATYALSLGLANGDLFTRIVAFSPGFVVSSDARGRPSILIAHGRHDRILPIERCGRPIAANLRRRGYEVVLREFEGGHELPEDVVRDGLVWAAGQPSPIARLTAR